MRRFTRIIGWAGLAALTVAVGVGIFVGPEALMELSPRCMFHELSGHECPTCGMTRALAALCQRDVAGMLHHNAASPLILAATVWGLVWMARGARRISNPTTAPSIIAPRRRLRAMASGLIELVEEPSAERSGRWPSSLQHAVDRAKTDRAPLGVHQPVTECATV